jgi:chromosome partitioning protein
MVLSIANHKGGVGKTTTAVHLGVGLAGAGKRTLLWDLDHQGHSSRWVLSHEAYEAVDKDFVEVLTSGQDLTQVIVPTLWPGLDLVPSSPNVAALDAGLVAIPRREERLRRALAGVGEAYDYVIIDCPPAAGILAQNALAASDWILAPIVPANLALAGLSDFYTWVEVYRREEVHSARWLGLLPTQVNDRTRISREVRETLSEAPFEILPAVPQRVGVEDLVAARAVASPTQVPDVAAAYALLTDHVLRVTQGSHATSA